MYPTTSADMPMSHIIATDAPLLSPPTTEALLEPSTAAFFAGDPSFTYEPFPSAFAYACAGASDAPALKRRASPAGSSSGSDDAGSRCVSTRQVFNDYPIEDLTPDEGSPAPTSAFDAFDTESPRDSVAPVRTAPRKPHRVTTKEFIPPDVSGLSKREARLVKNRAAAFLSRQRKREEFEHMEVRVAELEQENALLRGATHALGPDGIHSAGDASPLLATSAAPADETLLSEIEQLRAQLAAAQEQTAALNARLAHAAAPVPAQQQPVVKPEPVEYVMPSAGPSSPRSRSSSVVSQKPERSGASLGLMVLLCALPTLLSMPSHSTLPARLTMPGSALAAHRHTPSHSLSGFEPLSFLPSEPDYMRLADMDVDSAMSFDSDSTLFSLPAPTPSAFAPRREESTLAFADSEALGLGDLDISFDAVPAQDGKIRVRIHPAAGASGSGSNSPSAWGSRGASPFPAMPGAFSPEPDADAAHVLGPFLGVSDAFDSRASYASVGAFDDLASPLDAVFDSRASFGSFDSAFEFGGSARASPAPAQGRRRVRIALKSVPAPGGEGGEWEVEVC